MKKVLFGCLLALMAAMLFFPAVAGDDDGEKKISVHGEVRARWEYLDNFTDFTDTADGDYRDSFDFMPYRVRIGVKGEFSKNVSAYIEIQNHGAFGDSFPLAVDQGTQDPPSQNLRGNYLTNETVLYQGYIDMDSIGGSNFDLRIGRQEHTLGNELLMGDADFYNGRSFDGLRGTFDYEEWDLDLFWYTISERDVLPGMIDTGEVPPVNGGSDDSMLLGVTANFKIGDTEQDLTPYILYFKNGNEMGLFPKMSFYTIGMLWDRPVMDDKLLDWSLEYAIQTGETGPGGDTDISTDVLEGWIGFNFGDNVRNRFAVGTLMLSDNDSSKVESFIPLFGDTHERAGLADVFSPYSWANGAFTNTFHNLTDIWGSWDLTVGNHNFLLAYHDFTATEENQTDTGDDDFGSEIDLRYQTSYSHNLGFEVGIASFDPGDAWFGGSDADTVLRVWGQARLRF